MNILPHCAGTGGRGVGGGGRGEGNFLDAHHFVSGCKLQIFEVISAFRLKCQYCIEPSGQNASSLKHTVHCTLCVL